MLEPDLHTTLCFVRGNGTRHDMVEIRTRVPGFANANDVCRYGTHSRAFEFERNGQSVRVRPRDNAEFRSIMEGVKRRVAGRMARELIYEISTP